MSVIVSWIAPDQVVPLDVAVTVEKVKIYKSIDNGLSFAEIAMIDAKDPVTLQFITTYEDTDGNTSDQYQISFVNVNGDESSKTEPGTGGFLSVQHEFLEDLRFRLNDFDPSLYRLDEPQNMWSTTQLWRFLNQALNKVNQTGPRLTQFTFENVVCTELVKDYAIYLALKARGILENFNQFQFNDGVSLNWNRAQALFSASDGTYNGIMAEIKGFKLAYRPRAIALGSQRIPFKILRPLSFMPNMTKVFGV